MSNSNRLFHCGIIFSELKPDKFSTFDRRVNIHERFNQATTTIAYEFEKERKGEIQLPVDFVFPNYKVLTNLEHRTTMTSQAPADFQKILSRDLTKIYSSHDNISK